MLLIWVSLSFALRGIRYAAALTHSAAAKAGGGDAQSWDVTQAQRRLDYFSSGSYKTGGQAKSFYQYRLPPFDGQSTPGPQVKHFTSADVQKCVADKWVHFYGDSRMRFLYAAAIKQLLGDQLPNSQDDCPHHRACPYHNYYGSHSKRCIQYYKGLRNGTCWEKRSERGRFTFEWNQWAKPGVSKQSILRSSTAKPDVLFVNNGIWAVWNNYITKVVDDAAKDIDARHPPALQRGQQDKKTKTTNPPAPRRRRRTRRRSQSDDQHVKEGAELLGWELAPPEQSDPDSEDAGLAFADVAAFDDLDSLQAPGNATNSTDFGKPPMGPEEDSDRLAFFREVESLVNSSQTLRVFVGYPRCKEMYYKAKDIQKLESPLRYALKHEGWLTVDAQNYTIGVRPPRGTYPTVWSEAMQPLSTVPDKVKWDACDGPHTTDTLADLELQILWNAICT